MKYWVGVVSKDHVLRGTSLGIAQIGRGKRTGLARMKAGDWLIYYSPKQSYGGTTALQAFTAIGKIADENIWQADEGNFKPFRRKVQYVKAIDAPIKPLLDALSFTAGKTNWGYLFRLGLFEITQADFELIAQAMTVSPTALSVILNSFQDPPTVAVPEAYSTLRQAQGINSSSGPLAG